MSEASIPVDIFNPGQVFACLGFLEAADVLLGDAEGRFDWSGAPDARFLLKANGGENPLERVLTFVEKAEFTQCEPVGFAAQSQGDEEESMDDEETAG